MIRLESPQWEVVSLDNRRTRFDTREDAVANRGAGQLRESVSYRDVPAVYEVRLEDGSVVGREVRAADAGIIARDHPGAKVYMVPEDDPASTPS